MLNFTKNLEKSGRKFVFHFASNSEIMKIDLYKIYWKYMEEQTILVKTVTDSAVLVGLTAWVGFIVQKMVKEHFLGDPSSSIMNYAKFTGMLAWSVALKSYLED